VGRGLKWGSACVTSATSGSKKLQKKKHVTDSGWGTVLKVLLKVDVSVEMFDGSRSHQVETWNSKRKTHN